MEFRHFNRDTLVSLAFLTIQVLSMIQNNVCLLQNVKAIYL